MQNHEPQREIAGVLLPTALTPDARPFALSARDGARERRGAAEPLGSVEHAAELRYRGVGVLHDGRRALRS